MVQLQSVPMPPVWIERLPDGSLQLTLAAHDFLVQLWRRTGGHSDYIREALAFRAPIAITVTGDVTMSSQRDTAGDPVEQNYGIIILEGTPGAAFSVTFTDDEGRYLIVNDTASTATIKTGTDTTGVTLAAGRVDDFAFDPDFTVRNLHHVSATNKLLGRDTAGAGPVEEIGLTSPLQLDGSQNLEINIASDRLLGRDTAGAGVVEQLTLNATLEFTGSTSIQRAALTGDVTASAGSNTTALNPGGAVVVASDDKVLILDTSDADSFQHVTAQSIADLTATLTTEQVQDIVGAMFTGNTETLITATYQDVDGTIDLVVAEASIDHGSIAGLSDDDHTIYLLADGTRALTAAWDAGSFQIRAETFQSDVVTGTAPLTVASTTAVTNLNADLVDGEHASAIVTSTRVETALEDGTWTTVTGASGDLFFAIDATDGGLKVIDFDDLGGSGSGATTALDNLASVAINTSLVSDTDSTDNLGSSLIRWATLFVDDANLSNDLLMASGGIINFDSGDITLTHSANNLTFAGGTLVVGTVDINGGAVDGTTIGASSASTGSFTAADVTKTAGNAVLTVETTGNANAAGIIFTNEDSSGTGQEKAWLRTISNTADTSSSFQVVVGSNMGTGIQGTPLGSPAFYYFTPQAMGIHTSPAGNGPLYVGLTTDDLEITDASDSAGTISINLGGNAHTLYTDNQAWVLLDSSTADGTGNTVSVTSVFDTTYDNYLIELVGFLVDADGDIYWRFTQSGTPVTGATDYQWSHIGRATDGTIVNNFDASDGWIQLTGGVDGDATSSYVEGTVRVMRPGASGNKKMVHGEVFHPGTGEGQAFSFLMVGRFLNNTNACDGFQLIGRNAADTANTNISGTVRTWGIPKS